MIIKYNFQQTETPALNIITHIFSRLVIPHKLTTTTNSFLLGSIDVDRNQFLGWCFSESLEKYQRIPYFVPKVPICSTSCFNKWYHSRDGKRTLLDAIPSLFGYMQISSQTTKKNTALIYADFKKSRQHNKAWYHCIFTWYNLIIFVHIISIIFTHRTNGSVLTE